MHLSVKSRDKTQGKIDGVEYLSFGFNPDFFIVSMVTQFQTDKLIVSKPSLVFYFDLDALASENEEYELVWDKIESALITLLNTLSRSAKPAVAKQSFYLWGQLGTTVNTEEHLCNAYFIFLTPETEIVGLADAFMKVFDLLKIFWGIEEYRSIDEECVPLFKYEQGNIIRYVFDQIGEDGQEDLGCSNIEFVPVDIDWYICPGAYSIDMATDRTVYKLTSGKTVSLYYRKFTIETPNPIT